LVLPEVGEPRLTWAVLRREAGATERLLLVAADVNPLVASGDVSVPGPGGGRLTLRCRSVVWVNERELRAASLLGTLAPEALALAEARRQALEAGPWAGTFSEQETEEDPEYQDWIEDVVRPAAAKLEARTGTAAATTPSPVIPFPDRRSTEPRPSPRGAWMRWAAVLAFVVLGAGNGFLWWRQEQKVAGLRAASEAREAAQRQAIAELEARRAALEAQYQARLREAGEDRARLESEHQARLQEVEAELAKLRQATEVRNPMLAALGPGAAQRGTTRIKISPEASHLVLLLPVDDPAGTEFQIDVSERPSGKQVFVQKGLRADDLGEVRPGLPTVLLASGDYRLRLFRKEGGNLRLVREHLIAIDKEPRPRPARW
jgi:cell division protein FtsB